MNTQVSIVNSPQTVPNYFRITVEKYDDFHSYISLNCTLINSRHCYAVIVRGGYLLVYIITI